MRPALLGLIPCLAAAADTPYSVSPYSVEQVIDTISHVEHEIAGTIIGQTGFGSDPTVPGDRLTTATVTLDWRASLEIEGGFTLTGHVDVGNGNGLDNGISSIYGFNGDAWDIDGMELRELRVDWSDDDERYRLAAGQLYSVMTFDLNRYANYEVDQFLSGGFVNNVGVPWTDPTLGIEAAWMPCANASIVLGGFAIDPDDIDAGSFWILESTTLLGEDLEDPFVSVRLGLWIDTTDQPTIADPSATGNNRGIALNADLRASDTVGCFFRMALANAKVVSSDLSASLGLQWMPNFADRDQDRIGVAVGLAMVGADADDDATLNGDEAANEMHAEAYYLFQTTEAISITVNGQVGQNLDLIDSDTVVALGLRLSVLL